VGHIQPILGTTRGATTVTTCGSRFCQTNATYGYGKGEVSTDTALQLADKRDYSGAVRRRQEPAFSPGRSPARIHGLHYSFTDSGGMES